MLLLHSEQEHIRVVEPFFRRFKKVKLGFWVGIGTLGGVIFFRWDLKTPCIKNKEYESQTEK